MLLNLNVKAIIEWPHIDFTWGQGIFVIIIYISVSVSEK